MVRQEILTKSSQEMGFQLMLTGVTPGHGDFSVKAVNVPVSVCSMDVCPGEIIHMDENGACKFPVSRIEEVVALCEKLAEKERKQMEEMRNANDISKVGHDHEGIRRLTLYLKQANKGMSVFWFLARAGPAV